MGKSITINCTVCGRTKSKYVPSKYGESGTQYEETFVAGCDKCARERQYNSTVSHSSGGGGNYSSSGGDSGCVGTIGGLMVLSMIMVCCCGGLGGKS